MSVISYKTARGYEALKRRKPFGVCSSYQSVTKPHAAMKRLNYKWLAKFMGVSPSYKTARGYEALKLCALKPAHRAGEKAQKGK